MGKPVGKLLFAACTCMPDLYRAKYYQFSMSRDRVRLRALLPPGCSLRSGSVGTECLGYVGAMQSLGHVTKGAQVLEGVLPVSLAVYTALGASTSCSCCLCCPH